MPAPLIWLDLLNSPNVLFCRPLIAELDRRGYRTCVTARDFAQTVAMCRLYGLEHTVIGGHGGATLLGKALNLAGRVRRLHVYAARARPDAVLTHNSYSQLVVARARRLPSVTSMDYEYQPANHLAFRCADRVFVPEAFPNASLRRFGVRAPKVWKYPGIKEDISLAGFSPTPGYRSTLGVRGEEPLVVVRPPARFALYHRFENPLFSDLLGMLRGENAAHVLVLPRTQEQAAELNAASFGSLVWDGPTFSGPDLISAADLVITAGGTMAREAAALGTPAYSVYAGKMAAIDLKLETEGRLTIIRTAGDLAKVRIQRKRPTTRPMIGDALVRAFIDHVEQSWRQSAERRRRAHA